MIIVTIPYYLYSNNVNTNDTIVIMFTVMTHYYVVIMSILIALHGNSADKTPRLLQKYCCCDALRLAYIDIIYIYIYICIYIHIC